jgi:hypothetical protein
MIITRTAWHEAGYDGGEIAAGSVRFNDTADGIGLQIRFGSFRRRRATTASFTSR